MGSKTKTENEKRQRKSDTVTKKSLHGEECRKKKLGGFLFTKMAKGGAAELTSNADEVNRLNVFPVPDGDTGDNMRMTIESGIAAIENLNSDNLAEVMRVLSHGMLLGARGNSGVILSQFFAGVAAGFEDANEADVEAIGRALQTGVKQAYKTVVTPTEGTILTVAREAVDFAVSKITSKTTIKSFFGDLVSEMYASLERTPQILPRLRDAGVVDSGGAGLFYIMDGFRRVLNGEEMRDVTQKKSDETREAMNIDFDSVGEHRYCTELLIKPISRNDKDSEISEEGLRARLSEIGDSVATVFSSELVKIHVHTNTPEKALSIAHEYGEFLNVKIENMTAQESESGSSYGKTLQQGKENAIIAVSSGKGISNVFYELGADMVLECKGGQNPSAKEFISAFEKTNAKNVFVMPNNSNILLTAKQAAQIYKRAAVTVLETKSIGMGYAALAAFDHENADTYTQKRNVMREITSIADGYVSPAVRDAEFDGIKIKRGDTIGIAEGKIAVCKKSLAECATELACILLFGKSHLVLFYGADVTEKEAERLTKKIKSKAAPSTEICILYGGQDIYPYIFIARS